MFLLPLEILRENLSRDSDFIFFLFSGDSMPSSRSKHAGCVHAASGHVYILAGRNGNVALRDFWRFHPGNGLLGIPLEQ